MAAELNHNHKQPLGVDGAKQTTTTARQRIMDRLFRRTNTQPKQNGIAIAHHFILEDAPVSSPQTEPSILSLIKVVETNGTWVQTPSFDGYTLAVPDTSDKYTHNLARCIGLVVSGESSEASQVSALFHIQPVLLINQRWREALTDRLKQFGNIVEQPDRLAAIAGGLATDDRWPGHNDSYKQEYKKLVKIVTSTVKGTLKADIVIHPPKTETHLQHVYYRTAEQKLDIVETENVHVTWPFEKIEGESKDDLPTKRDIFPRFKPR